MDANKQTDWKDIVTDSDWNIPDIARVHGVSYGQLLSYLYVTTIPKKNMPKMIKIMEIILKTPRMKKHPSFGYATEDEIKKLQTMGHCPERDMILKTIEKRTASGGKTKRWLKYTKN